MNQLEKIESLVKDIPCPICLNSRFEVHMSCDLPRSPCDFHAECQHCHNKILVTNETKTMEKVWAEIQESVMEKGCPECGDKKLHLEFLCHWKSEDCYFLVRCEINNHYSRLSREKTQYLFY